MTGIDSKITGLTELAAIPASGDMIPIVDVSDPTESAGGTSKRVAYSYLVPGKAAGSDVITGTNDDKFVTSKSLKDAGVVPTKLIGAVPHRQFWIGNMDPAVTSGCAARAPIEMGTNKNVYYYWAFDKASVEYAIASVNMPEDYTGGVVYAQFKWLHPATTTNFKVSWGLSGVCFANDETLDAAQGTPQYGNDTGGTTSDFYDSPQTTAITIAGTPAASVYTQFRISRKADDATNDTLDVDAYLLGVILWYPVA